LACIFVEPTYPHSLRMTCLICGTTLSSIQEENAGNEDEAKNGWI
jgi:hypothetical protein